MIEQNLKKIQKEIKLHSPFSKRVKIVAVSKNRSPSEINQALGTGIKIIGENRVQEAKDKFPKLKYPAEKHFVGHLQTNKVKLALSLFDLIESVDSLKLAQKIEQEAEKMNRKIPVLIQINISKDPRKFGLLPEEVEDFLFKIKDFKFLKVQGLMTIGKLMNGQDEIRSYFRTFKKLFDQLKTKKIPGIEMKYLGMGMSDDFIIALEEGANLIRLGRAIFEENFG